MSTDRRTSFCSPAGVAGRLAALVLTGVLAGCGGDAAPDAPDGPPTPAPRTAKGVILFCVDTLRADHLSCYGYERRTSPNIDAWAAGGTRWARAYSQGSWTRPSMLSMMTGLYLSDHAEILPRSQPTIAEIVSEGGVQTGAFVANVVLSKDRGFERGFDHFEMHRDRTAGVLVDHFEAWHTEIDQERPWFAWIHAYDPHSPYSAPHGDRVYAWNDEIPRQEPWMKRWSNQADMLEERYDQLELRKDRLTAFRWMRENVNEYDNEIHSVDLAFGRLLDHLDQLGVRDDVVILLVADHGEMLFEYPEYDSLIRRKGRRHEGGLDNGLGDFFMLGHDGYFYQPTWRVPFIASGPGFEAGVVRRELGSNLDVFPTIVTAFGLEPPSVLDGVPTQADRYAGPDAVFGWSLGAAAMVETDGVWAVRTEDRLSDHYVEMDEHYFELVEPGDGLVERRLGVARRERLARMAARIRAWRASTRFEHLRGQSAEDLEALRELGYLDDLIDARDEGD